MRDSPHLEEVLRLRLLALILHLGRIPIAAPDWQTSGLPRQARNPATPFHQHAQTDTRRPCKKSWSVAVDTHQCAFIIHLSRRLVASVMGDAEVATGGTFFLAALSHNSTASAKSPYHRHHQSSQLPPRVVDSCVAGKTA